MQVEDALKRLDTLLPPGALNAVKTLVFREAWEDKSYAEIAEAADYDTDYVKIAAAQLWKALSKALDEKVTKKNFRSLLRQKFWTPSLDPSHPLPVSPSPRPPLSPSSTTCSWSSAPDISTFFGRTEECEMLQRCILSENCHLIAVLGMGGIGKTSLATKVARDLQGNVDYIFWRSLRNAPPLDKLLTDMVAFLTDQTVLDGSLDGLLEQLRSHRCLIILDNAETLFQPGLTGHYRPGYEGYGDLFRTLGETAHQSCLLLTSREKPPEVAALEGIELGVKTHQLQGSLDVSMALIQAKGLTGTPEEQHQLCEQYGCSPLALKIVATSIQDLFDGQIAEFLQERTTSFNGIRRLLDQHWQRLSLIERSILQWLAINRTWTSVSDLHQDMVPAVARADLLEALESLSWRSLVERRGRGYSLQPVVLEYVTDNLIGRVFQELAGGLESRTCSDCSLPILCSHALIKTTAKDFVRATQTRLILAPIADLFKKTLATPTLMRNHLQALLDHFRLAGSENALAALTTRCPLPAGSGYGAGNVLNLCIYLGLELNNLDCSHLSVRHAYLRKAPLQGVNFAHAHFSETIFRQTFGTVLSLAYSPSGDCVAAGGSTCAVRIWRTTDGQLQNLLLGHQAWIWSLAYSPDGQRLASAGEEPRIKIWDTATGNCLQTIELPEACHAVYAVAFSPDGNSLAVGSNHPEILLYDLTTQQIKTLKGHRQDIYTVAFSPDQQLLVSGSRDNTVRLWHLSTGKCQQVWDDHQAMVRTVAFSPDGSWLISAGDDGIIRRWHLETGECLGVFEGHQKTINDVCISPDGHTLISGSEDYTIRYWDVAQGRCDRTLQGHGGGIWTIALSPDGHTLVSSSVDRQVRLWDLASGNSLRTLIGYTDYVYGLTFSPDGDTLAAASSNSRVRLWDWQTETCIQELQGHQNWVWDTAWSPDGQLLASGGLDHVVKIWHAASGDCLATLLGHENNVMTVAWYPQGHVLASASSDNTIRLWDPDSGQCQRVMSVPQGWIQSIAWEPTGKYLASGSSDNLVRLWDGETGEVFCCLEGHQGWVNEVTWTPDGQFLLSCSHDGTIKLWNIAQERCVKTLTKHTSPVFMISVSPDGRLLASGDFHGTIHLWDTTTWECIQTMTDHDSVIGGLAFHPTRPILASSSEDATIRIWDLENKTLLATLKGQRPYEGMNITGVTGLTKAEKVSLSELGASSHAREMAQIS